MSEELQLGVTKDEDKGEGGDTSSGGSGEEKEDCDDKKPMINKDVVKEKSFAQDQKIFQKSFQPVHLPHLLWHFTQILLVESLIRLILVLWIRL